MAEISWQQRLAIVLSGIWLALAGGLSADERNGTIVFLMFGILPIAFFWGIAWVWLGFRKQRAAATAPTAGQQGDESVAKVTLFRWLSIIFLAGGIGVFYYAFSKTSVEPAAKIGYLIGFYFWVPLLAYVLWKRTFKKKKGVGLLIFAVAFLGIAIYQGLEMLRTEEDAKLFSGKAQTMMLKLMSGELVERSELSAAGQYSSVLLITHDFLSQVFGDFQSLNTKIESSGLETILSPQTLQDSRKINAALGTLQELGVLIESTDNQIAARYDDFLRQIDSANIPYNVKADFKKGAERGVKRGKDSFAEFFGIQKSFIATAFEMLQFMKSRQGHFKQQGGRLLFDNQADLDAYSQYLQTIQMFALQESEWRNKQLSFSATQIEKIRGIQ